MIEVNQFTIDTGRGYEITGHASVEGDLFDAVALAAPQDCIIPGQLLSECSAVHTVRPQASPVLADSA